MRRAWVIGLVLSTFACEGATLRCDPSPSWSVHGSPDEAPDGGPRLCAGDCRAFALALGERHSCVTLGAHEEVVCFGANEQGQSSPQVNEDEVLPTPVRQRALSSEIAGVRFVAGALHTCVTHDGTLVCWGSPVVLGEGADVLPKAILEDAIFVQTGAAHVLVDVLVDTADDVWNGDWQSLVIGAWDGTDPHAPPPLGDARERERGAISAGGFVTWTSTWERLDSVLGMASSGGVPPPGPFPAHDWIPESHVVPLELWGPEWATGPFHSCRLFDGVSCLGANDRGQLGRGGEPSGTPVFELAGITIPELGAASLSSMCSGGTLDVRADEVGLIIGEARGGHSCVADDDGRTWCWGANDRGQLGDGTTIDRTSPVRVLAPPLRSVRCGGEHTCALTLDFEVLCWGDNRFGQLGIPSSELDLLEVPMSVSMSPAFVE